MNSSRCQDLDIPSKTYGEDGSPFVIGDGICSFIREYMNEECGFEGGDCVECKVEDHTLLGNGICDGGAYNTEACGFDLGDCNQCNEKVGSQNIGLVGNGICNGGQFFTEACNDDGGDCAKCDVDDPSLVGNGVCNVGDYMSDDCGRDGGDCDLCIGANFTEIGDGICHGKYNTKECSYDGGDCDLCNESLTGMDSTLFTKIGDGVCDGGLLNTEACRSDGGDCECINDALRDYCDLYPETMLANCRAACQIVPPMVRKQNKKSMNFFACHFSEQKCDFVIHS